MEIYISKAGSQEGPFTLEQVKGYLASGTYNDDDFAWYDGLSDWISIKDIPNLKSLQNNTVADPIVQAETHKHISSKNFFSFQKVIALITFSIIIGLVTYIIVLQKAAEQSRLAEEAKARQKPQIPEIFKAELIQFMKRGGELLSKSDLGIKQNELSDLTSNQKSSLDMLDLSWPSSFCPEAKEKFSMSVRGYILALNMWKLSYNKPPGYTLIHSADVKAYVDYLGNRLESRDAGQTMGRGDLWVNGDDVTKTLLMLAGTYFEEGRAVVTQELR